MRLPWGVGAVDVPGLIFGYGLPPVFSTCFQQRTANNPIYGLEIIGAAIYYISHATSFGVGVLGFLKAIVWPGVLFFYGIFY